ncbi:MAG TPA: hypothetical protein VF290_16015 [Pyrinomonadaceae bacterium]
MSDEIGGGFPEHPGPTEVVILPVSDLLNPVIMCTHGHSVVCEDPQFLNPQPGSGYSSWRWGGGGTFSSPANPVKKWFHFAIPSQPYFRTGLNSPYVYRAHIYGVALQFKSDPKAVVHSVHVYDQYVKIYWRDDLDLSGDLTKQWQSEGVPGPNVFIVNGNPQIWGPIGLSVGVIFHTASSITFTAAYAEFQYFQAQS